MSVAEAREREEEPLPVMTFGFEPELCSTAGREATPSAAATGAAGGGDGDAGAAGASEAAELVIVTAAAAAAAGTAETGAVALASLPAAPCSSSLPLLCVVERLPGEVRPEAPRAALPTGGLPTAAVGAAPARTEAALGGTGARVSTGAFTTGMWKEGRSAGPEPGSGGPL